MRHRHFKKYADDKVILKNRLKVSRAEINLSQSDFAKMVGVSRNTIRSIEVGQFNPTESRSPARNVRWPQRPTARSWRFPPLPAVPNSCGASTS
ncbi:MAG: helix-turn-helix domain-containing protein [Acidobacteria bacterium]|nr:helix-turn-helix domain-containing protein [Acidobacteriota bacterium]